MSSAKKLRKVIGLSLSTAVIIGLLGFLAYGSYTGIAGRILPDKTHQAGLSVAAQVQTTVALCPSFAGDRQGHTLVAAINENARAPQGSYKPTGQKEEAMQPYGKESVSSLSSAQINAARITAEPVESSPSAAMGIAHSYLDQGENRGLNVATCSMPMTSAWFIGASTTLGHSSELVLTNPSSVQVSVIISAWDATGKIEAGNSEITIESKSTESVRIDARYAVSDRLLIHMQSTGSGVVPIMRTSGVDGLTPLGSTFIHPSAEPAHKVFIPAVRLGIENQFLRIANPYNTSAKVAIHVVNDSERTILPGAEDISIPANSVKDVSLDYVDIGLYSLMIDSTNPVTAAAFVQTSPTLEKRVQSDEVLLETPDTLKDDSEGESDGDNNADNQNKSERENPADAENKDKGATAEIGYGTSRIESGQHDYTWIPSVVPSLEGIIVVPKDLDVTFVGFGDGKVNVTIEPPGGVLAKDKTKNPSLTQKFDKASEGNISLKLDEGVWQWRSQSPMVIGGLSIRDDFKGIAYVPTFRSAHEATTLTVHLFP